MVTEIFIANLKGDTGPIAPDTVVDLRREADNVVLARYNGEEEDLGSFKGDKGDRGDDGSNVLPTQTAVTNAIAAGAGDTRFAKLPGAAKNALTGWFHADGFGILPNGVDHTSKINTAIAAMGAGDTLWFPPTGPGGYYLTAGGHVIPPEKPNLRFLSVPRDAYASSMRAPNNGATILTVKAPGFVMQDIGIFGVQNLADGVTNGDGMTVNGVEIWGDTDGNGDALITGCTFQYLNVAVRTRSRNNKLTGTLFSNSRGAVVIDGKDATYHTGTNADQNRGNEVRGNRLHNIGSLTSDAAVAVTTTAKLIHGIIADNFFDSNGLGRHVVVSGTSANPHQRLAMTGNIHTELGSEGYDLTYLYNWQMSDTRIGGYTAGAFSGHGIKLTNCVNFVLTEVFLYQIGKHGILLTSCTDGEINGVKIRNVGMDPAFVGDGLNVDSTNSDIRIRGAKVSFADGYGFNGSPVLSSVIDSDFQSNTLGKINSTTVSNRSRVGHTEFVDGKFGHLREVVDREIVLPVGATDIATITSSHPYSSFEFEVKIVGRNAVGDFYVRNVRYVRPENGTPAYASPIADVVFGSAVTLAFTASGTSGVKVTATVTGSTAYCTLHITALSGGGGSDTNQRGVTVGLLL